MSINAIQTGNGFLVTQISNTNFNTIKNVQGVVIPASGDTDLVSVMCIGTNRLYIRIEVSGQALDAFKIVSKANQSQATYDTLYSLAADYTTPAGLIVGASGDLTTLAAGANGWLLIDVSSIQELVIRASAATNNASVNIYVSGAT